jgi:hypothetical protein
MENGVVHKPLSIAVAPKGAIRGATVGKELVILNVYKGVSNVPYEKKDLPIIFRLKVTFEGNLSKYIPVDALAAKEVIDNVDIDYDFVEVFFNRHFLRPVVKKVLYPLIDSYFEKPIGEKLGEIALGHPEFAEFVSFMRFLCYEPLLKKISF